MDKPLRINEEITAPELHLIMNDGRSAGTVSLDQARYLAYQSELDLVEIAPKALPPVARLLDYNKYRYQQEKSARQAGAKTRSNELKEVRLGFKTDDHDTATKAKRARQFLEEGHFVRVSIMLRGRENIFPDKAKAILESFREHAEADYEQPITHVGNKVACILKSKKNNNAKN